MPGESDATNSGCLGICGGGRSRNVPRDGIFRGENPAVSVDEKPPEGSLVPASLDLQKTSNRLAHRTGEYEQPNLILRRGQPFEISITFGRKIEEEKDKIRLQFTTGDNPLQSKGTLIRLKVSDTLGASEWGATVVSSKDNAVTLRVMPAADAIVGKYSLFVETYQEDDDDKVILHYRYKHDEDLYILFNAWCEEDLVYLDGEEARREYVLNERGRMWIGSISKMNTFVWSYSQFEDVCLKAAVYLLEQSYLQKESHGDPIRVTRVLSAMGNAKDGDNGVMVGNWTGNFSGGKQPFHWHDSAVILEMYMRYKRPVKYAQCWVFSGLLTTLGRALGIPTRPITTYLSGIDRDSSMTIDRHISEDGSYLGNLDENYWNYHVWNESWFRRPDLPDGNDGWQAYDASPQVASEGLMQCGPAPVTAVKEGHIYLGYDTGFLFASVNGDQVTWLVNRSNGEMQVYDVIPHYIGKRISTKAIGSNERQDITAQYKYEEGSESERAVVQRAASQGHRHKKLLEGKVHGRPEYDVAFTFKETVSPEANVTFALHVKNGSEETRNISVQMQAVAKYYTGVSANDIGKYKTDLTLKANGESDASWELQARDYLTKLTGDAVFGLYIMARVEETGQIDWTTHTGNVMLPSLQVKVSKETVKVDEEFEVEVSFHNPLGMTLHGKVLRLEGAGIQHDIKIKLRKTIAPGQDIKQTLRLKARRKGKREVIAQLSCKELSEIHGSAEVEVTE